MKRLKTKILNLLLGKRVFCLLSDGEQGQLVLRGSSSDLTPRILEAIEYHPTVRLVLVTAVAEYLRTHDKERLAFSKKIYNEK